MEATRQSFFHIERVFKLNYDTSSVHYLVVNVYLCCLWEHFATLFSLKIAVQFCTIP